jgi:1-acyl-sn-glycerol-3-phosphate acyltransferase
MATKSLLRKALLLPYQLYVILFFFPLTVIWKIVIIITCFADAKGKLAHRCWSYWARSTLALAGLRVRVEGLERLDPKRVYVFMSTHASFLDILLAFAYFPYNFRFIIKKEIFSIPFVGWALTRSGQIPIARENPRKGLKSLKQAEDLLREGVSVVVFPEGTRTPNGEVQEFKSMLFVLPIRSQTPVVPVLIEGTFQALKRGSFLLNSVPLRLTFYDPIPPVTCEERDRSVYAAKVRQVLLARLSS